MIQIVEIQLMEYGNDVLKDTILIKIVFAVKLVFSVELLIIKKIV
jgi:hypothetical protein